MIEQSRKNNDIKRAIWGATLSISSHLLAVNQFFSSVQLNNVVGFLKVGKLFRSDHEHMVTILALLVCVF